MMLELLLAVVASTAPDSVAASAVTPEVSREIAAARTPVGITTSLGAHSRYMWNGFDVNHGDPIVVAQVSYAPTEVPGLSLGTWLTFGLGNAPALNDRSSMVIDEFDLVLSYTREVREGTSLTLEVGHYYYPSDFFSDFGRDKHDSEIVLGVQQALSSGFGLIGGYRRGIGGGIGGDSVEAGVVRPITLIPDRLTFDPQSKIVATSQFSDKFRFVGLETSAQITWGNDEVALVAGATHHLIADPSFFGVDRNVIVGELHVRLMH